MSKAGRKKKGDDVLRAGDVLPPYGEQAEVPKKKTGPKKDSASKTTGKAAAQPKTTKSVAAGRKDSEIPQLDLDNQILAKQRRTASAKRRGPGVKSRGRVKASEAATTGRRVSRAAPELSERDRVIAEIVARDIERLCGQ
ncbi:MAG: hypothetical protein JW720_09575 [Sedimentisphaerales bacterium]|nr:hypothetical protein [Sedimentisphaerales bacterium]